MIPISQPTQDMLCLTTWELLSMRRRALAHPLVNIDPDSLFRELADRVAIVLDDRAARPADAADLDELCDLLTYCNDRPNEIGSAPSTADHVELGSAIVAEVLARQTARK